MTAVGRLLADLGAGVTRGAVGNATEPVAERAPLALAINQHGMTPAAVDPADWRLLAEADILIENTARFGCRKNVVGQDDSRRSPRPGDPVDQRFRPGQPVPRGRPPHRCCTH